MSSRAFVASPASEFDLRIIIKLGLACLKAISALWLVHSIRKMRRLGPQLTGHQECTSISKPRALGISLQKMAKSYCNPRSILASPSNRISISSHPFSFLLSWGLGAWGLVYVSQTARRHRCSSVRCNYIRLLVDKTVTGAELVSFSWGGVFTLGIQTLRKMSKVSSWLQNLFNSLTNEEMHEIKDWFRSIGGISP